MQAVADLGYTPNAAAKNLRTLRSGKLLVTVPDISNPFFSLILQGIEDAALREGYAVLLGDTQHDEAREERYARMLKTQGGRRADLPRPPPPEGGRGARPGERAALRAGRQRLRVQPAPRRAERAHRQRARPRTRRWATSTTSAIAASRVMTGPLVSPLSRDRLRGAMARATHAGAKADFVVLNGDFSIDSGIAAGRAAVRDAGSPTAVFCFNDEMAMGVIETARRHGVRVPDDLSVVGFDDIRFARHIDPPLTTIAQPMREIGEGCVRLLLEILRGGAVAPVSVTLPHHADDPRLDRPAREPLEPRDEPRASERGWGPEQGRTSLGLWAPRHRAGHAAERSSPWPLVLGLVLPRAL